MWLDRPIPKSPDGMYHISREEWNRRTDGGTSDACGKFLDAWGDHPELKGKRTAFDTIFTCKPMTCLLAETTGFIVDEEETA